MKAAAQAPAPAWGAASLTSPSSRPRPAKPLLDEVLDLLSNVMFPVAIFLVWAVATTIGTVVNQNQTVERYYQEYPEPVANAILRLHLTDVFHSVPYISLVVMLLLSMSVCTFRRVIPKRFPKDRTVRIASFGLHSCAQAPGNLAAACAAADAYFRRRGFAVRTQELEGTHWIFADKQKWARYGVLVAHLGFALISFGVFVGWLRGYSGQLQIFSGQTVAVEHTNLQFTLDKFTVNFQPVTLPEGGVMYQASKFQSDVSVRSSSGASKQKILVNYPYVSPDGTYFYQAGYGFGGNLQVTRFGKAVSLPGTDGRLAPQDGVFLPGTSRAIEYGAMLGPSDPSQVPPGVALPATDEYAIWIFHDNIPTTDKPILLPVGKSLDAGDGYVIKALPPVPWTGLTYRYDPGGVWVGIGCAVLVAGFVLALFFVPVKLYATLRAEGQTVVAECAATTTKGNAIYEEEFNALAGGFAEALARNGGARPEMVEAYA